MTMNNQTRNGFRLVRQEAVVEIDSEALRFQHQRSGAELVILTNEDDNKTFMVTFKTPPDDDTGVAHILEHSVLNGSQKYPVKEPFAELLKGSLYTFLNAMTYPDRTVYPVASRNTQDFFNLMDVYLDAVFNPLLTKLTFRQEGWHHAISSVDQPLEYSGVVYNEMLGSYSDPETVLGEELEKALFPDSVYGRSSGGDPTCIPDLSYEGFVEFYRRFYHPSNCLIFLYGDLDQDAALAHLATYLDNYEKQDVAASVTAQPRIAAPVSRQAHYPISPGEDRSRKTYAVRSYLLDDPIDGDRYLAFTILSQILSGTPASPLRKALIDSHLGDDTLNYGLENEILDTYYTIGLKGTDAASVPEMENVIDATLSELVKNGIDPKTIKASVNTVEFNLREANFGGYPKGLVYGLTMLNSWLYGADPLIHLRYETTLREIKQRIAAGPFFERMIDRYFIQNPHRVTLALLPDPDLEHQRREQLRVDLAAKKASLAAEQVESVVRDNQVLSDAQLAPDSAAALATIPKLPLSCVEPDEEKLSFELIESERPSLSFSDQKTNGIGYITFAFDVSSLDQALLPYLPLFGNLLIQVGTQHRSYVELIQEIGIHTGGLGGTYGVGSVKGDRQAINSHLTFSGKALTSKIPVLCKLLAEILSECDLENESRIRELIFIAKSRLQSAIIPGGHRFAARRLAAYHSRIGMYQEVTSGLSQYYCLEQLADSVENGGIDEFRTSLAAIRDTVLIRGNLHVHVTGSSHELTALQQAIPTVHDVLADTEMLPQTYNFEPLRGNEGWMIPSKIQFVGKGANIFDFGYEYDGHLEVVETLLNRDYLWNKVRVQGNAYGCFFGVDALSGNFCCLSYRDPKLADTIQVFDQIPAYLEKLQIDNTELERLIIATIGSLDAPRTPDQKGAIAFSRYLSQTRHADVQKHRDEVIGCRLKDLRSYAGLFRKFVDSGHICVVGSEEIIQRDRSIFSEIKHVFTNVQQET